ncbi:hypothetical protein ES703_21436 [subsurface metagenome]
MSNRDLVMKIEKLSNCSAIWNKIFEHTPDASPFLSYEWFNALCSNLLKVDPEVIIFWDGDSPVGIFPGSVENRTLRFISDERVTDLCDVIYLQDYEKPFIKALCKCISSEGWEFDLYPIGADSPMVRFMPEIVADVSLEDADLSPLLSLPDTWDEYLSSLGRKQRHELRRKMRKVSYVTLEKVEASHIEILFQFMSASSTEKKDFLSGDMRSFFKSIAFSFSKKGWLRYRASFLDTQPIGVLFSFTNNNHIFLYNMGFDPDYISLSPGIITIVMDIKSAITDGARWYDFLRGDERYKFNLGAKERYTRRLKR